MHSRFITHFIKPGIFWFFVFTCLKALFLVFHSDKIQAGGFNEMLKVFTTPVRLDIAAVAYIMAIPGLMLIVQFFYPEKFIHKFNKLYHQTMLAIVIAIYLIDIELYKHWQTKLNFKAFSFLNEPGLIAGSAGWESVIVISVTAIVAFLIFRKIYLKWIYTKYVHPGYSPLNALLLSLSIIGITAIGIRGGLQQVPVNQSDAYFSSNPALNYAGVNSLWNFGNTIFQNRKYLNTNPYRKMSEEDAEKITRQLFITQRDTTEIIITSQSPNIIMVVLEGFNAHVINTFDNSIDYAPNLRQIIDSGYLFSNMYGSGLRTDQGLVSLISGFPALPLNTIGAQPEKFQQLPSLSRKLAEKGYQSVFHFGGEPEFGSFKSFLVHNGFNPLIDFRSFPKNQLTQKLGAPDEFLFQRHLKDINSFEQPFLSVIMTQTSHEPFDMPFNKNVSDANLKYLNTIAYTDSVLGRWLEEIKNKDFYKNTLLIITSDHGHRFPGDYWYSDPKRFQIPLIFYGDVLKEEYRGTINHRYGSQTDIPYTLLKQLGITDNHFEWSKNLLNPYSPEFSFFIYINGFVFLTPEFSCGYEYHYMKTEFSSDENHTENCIHAGRAYMQHLFQTYLEY
jgi:phosphoglycerol transferase MdoB-like AlkP superfamily enzyme